MRKWGKKSCIIRSINEARRKETKTSYQDVMVPEAHDDDEAMHRSDLSDPMPAQSKTLREFPFEPIPSERRRIIEVQVQQKHPENMGKIDLVHISRNATVQYPTMLHSEFFLHISDLNGSLWDIEQVHSGICVCVAPHMEGMLHFGSEYSNLTQHYFKKLEFINWQWRPSWI